MNVMKKVVSGRILTGFGVQTTSCRKGNLERENHRRYC